MKPRSWLAGTLGIGVGIGIGIIRSRRHRAPSASPTFFVRRPDHLVNGLSPDSASSAYLLDAGGAGYLCAN